MFFLSEEQCQLGKEKRTREREYSINVLEAFLTFFGADGAGYSSAATSISKANERLYTDD